MVVGVGVGSGDCCYIGQFDPIGVLLCRTIVPTAEEQVALQNRGAGVVAGMVHSDAIRPADDEIRGLFVGTSVISVLDAVAGGPAGNGERERVAAARCKGVEGRRGGAGTLLDHWMSTIAPLAHGRCSAAVVTVAVVPGDADAGDGFLALDLVIMRISMRAMFG